MRKWHENIEGARGTIVWNGQPIPAMQVEVESVGDDFVQVHEVGKDDSLILVPVESILYFKFAGEND